MEATAAPANGGLWERKIYASGMQLALVLACLLATIAFYVVGTKGVFPQLPPLVSYLFLAVCLIFLACWVQQLRLYGPALVLTATSFKDARQSRQEIPWSEVRSVDQWFQDRRTLGMHLGVSDEFERTYRRYPLLRPFAALNRAMGIRGIWISTFGTKIGAEALYVTTLKYWNTYNSKDGSHV